MTKVEMALTEHVKDVHPRLFVMQLGVKFYVGFDHNNFGFGDTILKLGLHMARPDWIEKLREDFKPFKLFFDRLHKVLSLFENDKVEAGAVHIWNSHRPGHKTAGFSIATNIFRADLDSTGGIWRYRLGHEFTPPGPPASHEIEITDFEEWFHIFLHVLARHNVLRGEF